MSIYRIINGKNNDRDFLERKRNYISDTPVEPVTIKSLKVETNGVDYGMPTTYEPFDYMNWLYKQYGIDPSSMVTTE